MPPIDFLFKDISSYNLIIYNIINIILYGIINVIYMLCYAML